MLSIIIPVYNQHDVTRECLDALQGHTAEYELVIIDNGSEVPALPGSIGLPRELEHRATIIRNPANLGFPVAVNQGIAASRGDIICLLNNDVIVTPQWSDKLDRLIEMREYDIVGPMTNYAAGVQRTVVPVYYDRHELSAVAEAWGQERAGRTLAVNWITGFCFMFRRSLYDELGPFDESLWPCSGEEIDFCLRARAKGHTVGIALDCYVHHEGSVTFGTLKESYADIVGRNNRHLENRWGPDWARQLPKPDQPGGIRLNLGCGPFKLEGFVNIDKAERVQPDLLADVLDLPFEPGTVDEIYAGHLLEHFTFAAGQKALRYWNSLLKPGGKISVAVPDYDCVIRDYLADPTPEKLREVNDLYVYSEHQESPHRYMYSPGLLEQVMREAGFVDLERMPIDHPYFPMPVVWQVGFHGRKGLSE